MENNFVKKLLRALTKSIALFEIPKKKKICFEFGDETLFSENINSVFLILPKSSTIFTVKNVAILFSKVFFKIYF